MNTEETLFETDAKLRKDPSGVYKKEVEQELLNAKQAVKNIMDSGLDPEEFKKYDTMNQSIDTALVVVDKIWKRFNQ